MLSPIRILHVEALCFLFALAAIVGYQILTGQINMQGVLRRKDGTEQTSPERIQLLLATLAAAAHYAGQAMSAPSGTLPDVDRNWLYLTGGSSGIYVLQKAWNIYKAGLKLGDKS